MRSVATLIGASALVSTLAACSGGGGINNSLLCNPVAVQNYATPQMIYPVPGYAQVPANAMAMVVGYSTAPALAQTITFTPDTGSPLALGPFGAAPKSMPTPYVHKLIPGNTMYGVTMPAMAAHTHYTVGYRYVSSAGLCGQSTTTTVKMGDFTTI